jgi:hypothetical protein
VDRTSITLNNKSRTIHVNPSFTLTLTLTLNSLILNLSLPRDSINTKTRP